MRMQGQARFIGQEREYGYPTQRRWSIAECFAACAALSFLAIMAIGVWAVWL
jgi:hypothetical protein